MEMLIADGVWEYELFVFFFSSRRRHTRYWRDWSSDVCSSDLVIMKFENQRGKYMMHCHNLVHEDHDMMTQFSVGDDGGQHHPVHADPCKKLPAAPLFTRPPRGDDNSGKGSGSGPRAESGGSDAAPAGTQLTP